MDPSPKLSNYAIIIAGLRLVTVRDCENGPTCGVVTEITVNAAGQA